MVPGLADVEHALAIARRSRSDPQEMVPALIRTAWVRMRTGDEAHARDLFAEAVPLLDQDPHARPWILSELAAELGESATIRPILSRLPETPGRNAMLAVLDGDDEQAARLYAEAGHALFEAEARLRWGEQLIAAGRRVEGEVELEKALDFYRPIGATLFVERGERLLTEAATG